MKFKYIFLLGLLIAIYIGVVGFLAYRAHQTDVFFEKDSKMQDILK